MGTTDKHGGLDTLFQKKSTLGIIASMALPTIASQLIGVVYNYADSIYVGWLNQPEQVAAIALALPLLLLITALSNFWGIGGGSAVSRSLGQKHRQKSGMFSSFSFYGAFSSSMFLSVISWLMGDRLIRILGASETVLPYARDYFFWFFTIGAVPSVLSTFLAHLVRAEGYAKQAGTGLILGALLNILLDPFFIFQFGFGMGVAGAALATMISNLFSVLYFAYIVFRSRSTTSLSFHPLKSVVPWKMAAEVMSVGLPSALLMLLSAISNNVLNSLVASHGDRTIAAVGIAKKLDLLPNHISLGITQGSLPLMAYAFAAGKHEKLKDILYTTMKVSFLSLMTVVILLEIFARPMALMFIRDDETVRYATSFIRILCLSVPLFSMTSTINSFFQAINRPRTAFILSLIRKGMLDIPLMILFNALFFVTNIIWVQPIMDLFTVCISLVVARCFWRTHSFDSDMTA
ncbi:MAG: MATE family efflux transporter [Victivallales bacterium]|nr:MATE family efflux transporter [Victivallales bacterium]